MAHDLFVSYRRRHKDSVRPIVGALRAGGLDVWMDEDDIPPFAPITADARDAIGGSKAVLVYYSADYRESSACRWELRQAFVAALGRGDATDRVLVVNPEAGTDHIEPVTLRSAQHLSDALSGAEEVAAAIQRQVAKLAGPLGDGPPRPARWLPVEPTTAPRFVGRDEEMWRIHSALWRTDAQMTEPGSEGMPCVVVSGFAGLGKSLLAREYALRFAGAYPGGVFWLSAEDGADRAGQLRRFARTVLGPRNGEIVADLSADDVLEVLWTALADDGPFLWIVDNLPSATSREEAQGWLARAPGATIVTTRGREHSGWAPVVPLDSLSDDDALALLTSRRPPEDHEERAAATALLEELKGHPLALDVTGARARTQSYPELLAGVCGPLEHDPALGPVRLEELPTRHERGVAATLHRSIELLGEEARDILRLSSELAAEPMPADLLSQVLGACDALPDNAAARRRAVGLGELDAHSLVTPAGSQRWTVHRLVSRTMRGLGEPPDRRQALRSSAVGVLAETLGAAGLERGSREELIAHARVLASEAAAPGELDLLHVVAGYDNDHGAIDRAAESFRREHAARERVLGPEHTSTLRALGGVADALSRQGELREGRELAERVLDSLRRLVGPEHDETLEAMCALAEALRADGEYAAARELDDAVLEARRRRHGPDDPRTLEAEAAVALDLGHLGSVHEARALVEDLAQRRRRVLGDDHPDTLKSMANLVVARGVTGEPDERGELARTVADSAERVLGPDHPLTLHALSLLGGSHAQEGDEDEALALAARVLESRRRVFGPDHPATIEAEMHQAFLHQAFGDLDAARAIQEPARERLLVRLGPEHPTVLSATSKLATMLASEGDLEGARELLESVLEIRRRRFGERTGPTLTVMMLLTQVLVLSGELRNAARLAKRTLRLTQDTFGRDHPRTHDAAALLEHIRAERRSRRPLQVRIN